MSASTYKCNLCHNRQQVLRRMYGKWPTEEFLSLADEQQREFMQIHESVGRDALSKKLQRMIVKEQVSQNNVLAEGGAFQPLTYWNRQGYDASAIMKKSSPEDRMEHPIFGTVYRVPILTRTTSYETQVVKSIEHVLHQDLRPQGAAALTSGGSGSRDDGPKPQDEPKKNDSSRSRDAGSSSRASGSAAPGGGGVVANPKVAPKSKTPAKKREPSSGSRSASASSSTGSSSSSSSYKKAKKHKKSKKQHKKNKHSKKDKKDAGSKRKSTRETPAEKKARIAMENKSKTQNKKMASIIVTKTTAFVAEMEGMSKSDAFDLLAEPAQEMFRNIFEEFKDILTSAKNVLECDGNGEPTVDNMNALTEKLKAAKKDVADINKSLRKLEKSR